jgi:phosphoglycerol transferase
MRNQFNSNRDFTKKIEQEMPAGSMIFQLPITTFPEGGDYSLVLGYVHSKNLRWSFPAIKGRESAIWQEKVVKLNFKEFKMSIATNFNVYLINLSD